MQIGSGVWLLDVTFRVPTRAFSNAEVRRLVPLKTLDEMSELPIYGKEPRVNDRNQVEFETVEPRTWRLDFQE
jgi:hypothetical protein